MGSVVGIAQQIQDQMGAGKCMAPCAFLVTYLVRLPTTGLGLMTRDNFRVARPGVKTLGAL